jgi:hypothetical protein
MKKKMPLTGFDIYRLRIRFMERILILKFIVASGEKDHGLKSLKPLGVKLRKKLTKALEDCHPFVVQSLNLTDEK